MYLEIIGMDSNQIKNNELPFIPVNSLIVKDI
jgi:hypothetical protein